MKKTLATLALLVIASAPALANSTTGLAQKQAYEAAEIQAHQHAASHSARTPKYFGYLPGNVRNDVKTGIFQTGLTPFHGYTIVNQWQGMLGGDAVHVYAGSRSGDRRQGVLVVMAAHRDLSWSAPQVIALGNTGPARIVGAMGSSLRIALPSGQSFTFQVPDPRSLPHASSLHAM